MYHVRKLTLQSYNEPAGSKDSVISWLLWMAKGHGKSVDKMLINAIDIPQTRAAATDFPRDEKAANGFSKMTSAVAVFV